MSTARNRPCPCGSGKKYKKCCLKKNQPSEPKPTISAHAMARKYDDPEFLESNFSGEELERAKSLWTPRKIQALTEDEIIAGLKEIDVVIDRDKFAEMVQDYGSGWALAKHFEPASRELEQNEKDFLALAVCELWKHWFPRTPCIEFIEDKIYEGYENRSPGVRLRSWNRAWPTIARQIPSTTMTVAEGEQAVGLTISFSQWLNDYLELLCKHAPNARISANTGILFATDLLRMFPGEIGPVRQNALISLGTLSYWVGEKDRGNRAFYKAAEENKKSALPRIRHVEAFLATLKKRPGLKVIEEMEEVLDEAEQFADAKALGIDELHERLSNMRSKLPQSGRKRSDKS